ncbi:MAG: type I-C CRISPR-associated protein Cas8c/Csd1 [Nitrospira sp.]|nr:type I-C CRISPR-associated protein Cas8c/Csd1 [Nitrospira sp.]
MLLKVLYEFAHSRKLLDDLAFAPKAIRWIIPLDGKGNLIGTGPQETTGKKSRGEEYPAPQTTRPKNAGGIAEFLADNLTGVFSLDTDPEKDKDNEKKRKEREANNAAKYKDFWQQIKVAHKETKHPGLYAMRRYHVLGNRNKTPSPFLRWGVSREPKPYEKPHWRITTASGNEVKLGPDNFTFRVNDDLPLVDETILRPYWRRIHQGESEDTDTTARHGICLITGRSDVPIAMTHVPKIKGVPKTHQSGAAIVSFDKPAFTSYGFDQSHNAPASTAAVSAYCKALNFLLSQDDHKLRIGQTCVCFWARETKEASSFFARMLNHPDPASVAAFLRTPWAGVDREMVRHDQFYSVTLSAFGKAAGRITVRHWMQTTLESARENLRKWFSDLGIVTFGNTATQDNQKRTTTGDTGKTDGGMPPLALFRLACTSVRDAKDLQTEMLTQLYRASLENTAPSPTLLKPILNRLNADLCRFGTGILETPISGKAMRAIIDSNTPLPPPGQSRMALLRMILNRNMKEGEPMIEPNVYETHDPAYNCGRLLAIFDDLQMQAHSYKLEGAGVVERYYGSASSAPNSAFGILWRLHQHHLRKISRNGDAGKRAAEAIKRRIGDIAALLPQPAPNLPPQFPRTFSLQEQGRFALGFYQQIAVRRAAIDEYKRKKKAGELKPEEIDDVLELADSE